MKVTQLCLALCDPTEYTVHGILQANTGLNSCSLLQGNLPNPGIKPRSPTLQADSLPVEPPGKPYPYQNVNGSTLRWINRITALSHLVLDNVVPHTKPPRPTPDKAQNWVLQMHGGPRDRGKQPPGTRTRNQMFKTQETP